MGHDKNGEFRLKGYNTAAFIPSKLWNYFLKDGAIYGIVFSRPLTVNVNDPAQAFPTFTIECSKDMSVFDMRHRLFEKIVELQPLEGYWAPETAGHLVVQRLFSEAKIPDDHLLRDCVEWTPDHVNITVTGLVRYDDSVMQDDWILNGENIDEDDTADAEDATNTNAEVGNTGAEGMDLQAAKEQPRSIEASGVTLPGKFHFNPLSPHPNKLQPSRPSSAPHTRHRSHLRHRHRHPGLLQIQPSSPLTPLQRPLLPPRSSPGIRLHGPQTSLHPLRLQATLGAPFHSHGRRVGRARRDSHCL